MFDFNITVRHHSEQTNYPLVVPELHPTKTSFVYCKDEYRVKVHGEGSSASKRSRKTVPVFYFNALECVGTVPECFKALNQDLFLIFLQLQITTFFLVVPLLLLLCNLFEMKSIKGVGGDKARKDG
jgi:hypothetical protein